MNNIKKIITIHAITLIAVMFLGNVSVYASEVTGTLSSSSATTIPSGSQSEGTVGGNVGGSSTVSGTIGGSSDSGSTISGTVSGSGGGGASLGGGQSNSGEGFVLGESTIAVVPNLPNTGMGPDSLIINLWSFIILFLGLILGGVAYYSILLLSKSK